MLTQAAMKIRELRVRAVKVPMVEPHRTASGTITESPLVLTDVLTDAGVVQSSLREWRRRFERDPRCARIDERPEFVDIAVAVVV